jgi:hypothetical protein
MIRRSRLAVAVAVALALAACASPGADDEGSASADSAQRTAGAITKENWLRHPSIIEVRDAVREIENSLPLTSKAKSADELCGESGVGDTERVKYFDATGRVRKYASSGGSDDSFQTITYYYDAKGTLRFVFDRIGNVYGYLEEHRAYFDGEGKRIWTVFRHTEDPERATPNLDDAPFEVQATERFPLGDEAKDPATMFDAKPSCG